MNAVIEHIVFSVSEQNAENIFVFFKKMLFKLSV